MPKKPQCLKGTKADITLLETEKNRDIIEMRIEMQDVILTLVDANGRELEIKEFQGGYLITQKGIETIVLMPFASNAVRVYSVK